MKTISRILAVVDPTAANQPALHRACWLAEHIGAELELFVCYYNEYMSGHRLSDSPWLENARAQVIANHAKNLEELAEPLRKTGVVVRTTVAWDHPLHEGIVRQAVSSGADIVIKDTHHHSALARALFSNTDWNLIRTCPLPLWLVKPGDIEGRPTFIAAIDPMNEHDKPASLDDKILQLTKLLSNKLDGEVHTFHSYDPRIATVTATEYAYIPISLPLDDFEKRMHEDHYARFNEIASSHGLADSNIHLVSGLTHEELPRTATAVGADIVVMGAVARNRWKRLFIGATAERTLEHLPCDLLIVKPDWFQTPVDVSNHEAA
jgi:universal stress protein E